MRLILFKKLAKIRFLLKRNAFFQPTAPYYQDKR